MAEQPKTKSQAPKDVMGWLHYYLVTKAPFQIPDSAKEWIVKYSPWIDLVLLVLFAPALLFVLGLGTIALPLSVFGDAGAAGGLSLAMLVLVVQIVLMVAALPGLFGRRMSGWNLSFYSVIFNLVYGLVNYNIVSALVGALISAYILFQIRSYYK